MSSPTIHVSILIGGAGGLRVGTNLSTYDGRFMIGWLTGSSGWYRLLFPRFWGGWGRFAGGGVAKFGIRVGPTSKYVFFPSMVTNWSPPAVALVMITSTAKKLAVKAKLKREKLERENLKNDYHFDSLTMVCWLLHQSFVAHWLLNQRLRVWRAKVGAKAEGRKLGRKTRLRVRFEVWLKVALSLEVGA